MPNDATRANLATLLEIDRLNYLPEYILRKVDLCTMAHGLELRAPFLDHRFVESLMGLPPALRFTNPPKILLAPALANLVDRNLVNNEKRGFNPLISGWLQSDLAPRLQGLGERLAALTLGQLSTSRIAAFTLAWRDGGRQLDEQQLQLIMLDESLTQLAALAALT
jgi:asparagine synthase (glutamine-hydrolysing)